MSVTTLGTTEPLRPVTGIAPVARDRWRLLLLGAVAGLLLGTVAIGAAPSSATATSTVQLGAGLVPVGEMVPTPPNAGDSVALARTRPVLEAVADDLDTDVDDVRESLEVSAQEQTSFLDFRYTSGNPSDAELGADAAAAAYLDAAQAEAVARWGRQKQKVFSLIETAPADDVEALRVQSRTLNETVVEPGTVVQPAAGTAEDSALPLAVMPVAGLLAGLLVALVVAYLVEARSPRLRRHTRLAVPGVRDLGALTSEPSVGVAGIATMLGVGRRLVADGGAARTSVRIGVDVLAKGRDDLVTMLRGQLAETAPDLDVTVVPVDLTGVEGLELASSCDGVVLVGVERVTRLEDVDRAVARLDFLDAPCFGIATVDGRRRAESA